MASFQHRESELSLGSANPQFYTEFNSTPRDQDGDGFELSLHTCVKHNDNEELRNLLEDAKYREQITLPDKSGLTPLHYAAKFLNVDAVKYLLSAKTTDDEAMDSDLATPLHYIARRKIAADSHAEIQRMKKIVRLFVDSGYCINAKDRYLSTPLHICGVRGNNIVAGALLNMQDEDKDTGVNSEDHLQCTPLHEAATYNHCDTAELFINAHADLQKQDQGGCTPLHLAAMDGPKKIVETLIKLTPEKIKYQLINGRDKDDATPLHYAIEAENAESVKLLVDNGASTNSKCETKKSGSSPIHLAAMVRNPLITSCLLANGAKFDARDRVKATPLHRAAEHNNDLVVRELLSVCKKGDPLTSYIEARDNDNYTALMTAAAFGSLKVFNALVEHHANMTVIDDDDRSVLHIAVQYDQLEIVQVILKNIKLRSIWKKKILKPPGQDQPDTIVEDVEGEEDEGEDRDTASEKMADAVLEVDKMVNCCDKHGDSPLHTAAQRGIIKIVRALLRNGADMTIKNEDEETPFLIACKYGNFETVRKFYVKNNYKLFNDEDENSNTALHLASEAGHLEVVKKLVEWGAKNDARNNRSRTALDLAAQAGHRELVEFFLDEEMPPDPVDKEKTTPLHMASRNGHDTVVAVLIHRGADVTLRDMNGNNCLDIAIDNDRVPVVRTILKSRGWFKALSTHGGCPAKVSEEEGDEMYADTGAADEDKLKSIRNTPLRKLIRDMPDMAMFALDRCVSRGSDHMHLDFAFLDDTFTDYDKLQKKSYKTPSDVNTVVDCQTQINDGQTYNPDYNYVKSNHPLSILIEEKNEMLLGHPLVLSLVRRKWLLSRRVYFVYMIFYLAYLAMLTSFMLIAEPPYMQNMTECEMETEWTETNYEFASRYIIWILAAMGIMKEIFQIFLQRRMYFDLPNLPSNALDWFSYTSAIILMINLTNCGARTDWQWQLGAFTILFTWLDLILFLRRLPSLGIYIVMITEVIQTFLKFFIALFLFVVAFSLTFFILVQNQDEFETGYLSMVKTVVMMIGEFDYGDMFFAEDPEDQIAYTGATYVVFILFAFLVSIIVMNLMIGLAVDDVNALRERAKVLKLEMQIELSLEVELAFSLTDALKLPKSTTKRWGHVALHDDRNEFMMAIYGLLDGPLLNTKAVEKSFQNQKLRGRPPELIQLEDKLTRRLNRTRNDVKSVQVKVEEIATRVTDLSEKVELKLTEMERMLRHLYEQSRGIESTA